MFSSARSYDVIHVHCWGCMPFYQVIGALKTFIIEEHIILLEILVPLGDCRGHHEPYTDIFYFLYFRKFKLVAFGG